MTMKTWLSLLAFTAFATILTAPHVQAAGGTLSLTGTPNAICTGNAQVSSGATAFVLGSFGSGPNVPLARDVPVTWIDPLSLDLGADLDGASLPFTLYFASASGEVQVEYGAFNVQNAPAPFRAFDSDAATF